jgi:dTDP-4-dehydrorhamnose 3,5-epimerase
LTQFRSLTIPDVVEVIPPKFGDERGYFSETYSRDAFSAAGHGVEWIQDNQSYSQHPGTVRGLHFQEPPVAQAKLVRVLRGAIFDVAVDIRKGSPSFGRWVGIELSPDLGNQLLVPIGFAHGFITLRPDTEVFYKVSDRYSKDHERAIRWDDPQIGIDWPLSIGEPMLSNKDREAPLFADLISPFEYRT